MSIRDTLNSIDRRYAWSLLGFVLATILGGVMIYTEFIREDRPGLRYEVISDASVLDVREELGNLEIIYDGEDLRRAHQSLRVIIFRVRNDGAEDILRTHYDQRAPLGFRVEDGTLLRAELLSASNSYLRETLVVTSVDSVTATFEPVILEADEWFTVKSLIIYSEEASPSIQPVGKVAGVRSVSLVVTSGEDGQPSFWGTVLLGSIWVQLTRLVIYFLGSILTGFVIIAPIVSLSVWLGKRSRRRHVRQFKSLTKLKLTEQDEYIFERYITNETPFLRSLKKAAANEEKLNQHVQQLEADEADFPEELITFLASGHPSTHLYPFGFPITDMKGSGYIVKRNDHWSVDLHMKTTLEEFMRFLEVKGAA